jgi:hypothetical protein
MRYTYSDNEDDSDAKWENSGVSTPLDAGPTVTSSGRQVKSRVGGVYGESMLIDQRKELERITGDDHFTETSDEMPSTQPNGKSMRTSRSGRQVKPPQPRYGDGDKSDDSDEAQSSGKEWSGDENEPDDESEPDFDGDDDDDEMDHDLGGADEAEEDENTQESLVVQLRYRKGALPTTISQPAAPLDVRNQRQTPSGDLDKVTIESTNGINHISATNDIQQANPVSATVASSDTIDVAPKKTMVNGTNSIGPALHGLPQALEVPVQPMDVS